MKCLKLKPNLDSIPEVIHPDTDTEPDSPLPPTLWDNNDGLTSTHFYRIFVSSQIHPETFEESFVTVAYILYKRYRMRINMHSINDTSSRIDRFKLFIVAYVIGMKIIDDEVLYITDFVKYLSKDNSKTICHIIERCEQEFCRDIGWKLFISENEYNTYSTISHSDMISNIIEGF